MGPGHAAVGGGLSPPGVDMGHRDPPWDLGGGEILAPRDPVVGLGGWVGSCPSGAPLPVSTPARRGAGWDPVPVPTGCGALGGYGADPWVPRGDVPARLQLSLPTIPSCRHPPAPHTHTLRRPRLVACGHRHGGDVGEGCGETARLRGAPHYPANSD